LDDGEPFTWVGAVSEPTQIVHDQTYGGTTAAALALIEAWEVTVLDPCWGRSDYLWPRVLEAVCGGRA
jgi:hypothetical protein